MKRTTIFVPEALERDLQLCARAEGRPAAGIVREALTEYLARRRPSAMLPSFVGAFASGRSDTAERHEELLFAGLDPHGGASVSVRRRRQAASRSPKTRRGSVTRRTSRARR
jgi:predicted transcriptional regulator